MVRESGPRQSLAAALSLWEPSTLALVTANSSWRTFGGDHPEDLLTTPFESYTASLAGKANPNRGVFE